MFGKRTRKQPFYCQVYFENAKIGNFSCENKIGKRCFEAVKTEKTKQRNSRKNSRARSQAN